MKENIYELLNHAEMNLTEFENQKLSDYESKIAKRQILKEVRNMKKSKKIWKKTLSRVAACACIMIGMGTISVAAGWLPIPESLTIFGIHTDEELEVVNMMSAATDDVAEDNGYKVSAEGIIGDGKNIGMVFKIEKSDGSTLLDNGKVPTSVEFRDINYENDSGFHGVTGCVDNSNHANSIEYYAALTSSDGVEDNVLVSLKDIQLWVDDEQTTISGKWKFDIPFEIQDVSVQLATGQKFQYGNTEGTMDELMVSPIGFSVRATTKDKLQGSDFIDMPMELHLKNGEVVALNAGCGPVDNGDGTWSWREDGVYGKLILLDNIESIVIGDTEFEIK